MPQSCAVSTCKNSQGSRAKPGKPPFSLHRFPKDKEMSRIWRLKCKRKDRFDCSKAQMCSDHFEMDQFDIDKVNRMFNLKERNLLKPGAVPTLNLPLRVVAKVDVSRRRQRLSVRNLNKVQVTGKKGTVSTKLSEASVSVKGSPKKIKGMKTLTSGKNNPHPDYSSLIVRNIKRESDDETYAKDPLGDTPDKKLKQCSGDNLNNNGIGYKSHAAEKIQKISAIENSKEIKKSDTLGKPAGTNPMQDNSTSSFKCGICGQWYHSIVGLGIHKRMTHGKRNEPVIMERERLYTASDLKLNVIYKGGDLHKCQVCGKSFLYQNSLVTHICGQTPQTPKYICGRKPQKLTPTRTQIGESNSKKKSNSKLSHPVMVNQRDGVEMQPFSCSKCGIIFNKISVDRIKKHKDLCDRSVDEMIEGMTMTRTAKTLPNILARKRKS